MMKRKFWLLLIIPILLLVAYLSGPRLAISTEIRPITLSDDLNAYVADQEAQFTDIRPNNEATIVWADPEQQQKTPLSFVFIHGFAASRQEYTPVVDRVAAHYEANIYYPRLTGHGRTTEAMLDFTVNAWLNDIVEAGQIGERLGEQTVFIGSSAGGALTTWLAAQGELPDSTASLVLLTPAFTLQAPATGLVLGPWGASLPPLLYGPYRESSTTPNELEKQHMTLRQPSEILPHMVALSNLSRQFEPAQQTLPLLILVDPEDVVVSAEVSAQIVADWGGSPKQLVEVDSTHRADHTIAGDMRSPETTAEVVQAIINHIDRWQRR